MAKYEPECQCSPSEPMMEIAIEASFYPSILKATESKLRVTINQLYICSKFHKLVYTKISLSNRLMYYSIQVFSI